MNEKPMKTAVVGCGAISDIYLANMINRFDILEVAACCARNPEHAARKAQQYGIKASTYEEIRTMKLSKRLLRQENMYTRKRA